MHNHSQSRNEIAFCSRSQVTYCPFSRRAKGHSWTISFFVDSGGKSVEPVSQQPMVIQTRNRHVNGQWPNYANRNNCRMIWIFPWRSSWPMRLNHRRDTERNHSSPMLRRCHCAWRISRRINPFSSIFERWKNISNKFFLSLSNC